jgi:hypothetical protein
MSEAKTKKEMTPFERYEAMKLEMSFNEIKHASQRMLKAQVESKLTSPEYKEACLIELKGREALREAMLKLKEANKQVVAPVAAE